MTNKKMSKFGRPKKIGKLKTFSQKMFYFPDSLRDVWKEYMKISKNRIPIKNIFPERCPQIQLKFLVLNYVSRHSENSEVKQKIKIYKKMESERFGKIIENFKKKKKERGEIQNFKTLKEPEEQEEIKLGEENF